LGQVLLRLHRNLEHAQRTQQETERQFAVWQARWSTRRDQIAQRLALIDAELEKLPSPPRLRPHLSVVSEHSEFAP